MMAAMTGRLLTRQEVADQLGVSTNTVRRLGAAGDLEEIRVSARLIRIPEESVQRRIGQRLPPPEVPGSGTPPAPVSRIIHGELDLALMTCKPSRDALRKAARDAADGQMVWIVRRDGQRIGAIVSVERAERLGAIRAISVYAPVRVSDLPPVNQACGACRDDIGTCICTARCAAITCARGPWDED
jgi:excisionase family DNA binding protein